LLCCCDATIALPAVARTKFVRLTQKEGADVIVGLSLNNPTKAMSNMANDQTMPYSEMALFTIIDEDIIVHRFIAMGIATKLGL
jgi:hypothetical protein